ncbi:GNAT family N-acetyltransferase [Arthrobacter bambusae]|uniref:Ribosomal-protein-alanine N-acetyltransferase n=1 Tax=Arthrobacter bambusae TaxID=1338426 RepID=A0AAW8DEG9_9MICC|nr:GNAT family protein [Arthrobacter bambusae]MDP9907226.1 ribosomal-protein-alanine N-acetyltransferase [Arthrobacter bambusae]MDQ0131287.1 ribosomal-protein-alanine N-acetyltransferase [Arthrobacter bambusae]MDQ0182620.1 ribosomal-protein-alanine N-acetyltransferase [Arthrobacter bambusae]
MIEPRQLSESVSMRVLRVSDAAALAAAYARNRAYLSPWEPVRPEEYYTVDWQSADIANRLVVHEAEEAYPLGLFDGGRLVGRFNVAGIVRGPFQSAGLGYWVDCEYARRGLASAAVRAIVEVARDELGLHRIEASTLLHNAASQRVLLKAGFQHIGMAPRYLQIAGRWQDHNLYQVVLHD